MDVFTLPPASKVIPAEFLSTEIDEELPDGITTCAPQRTTRRLLVPLAALHYFGYCPR